MDFIHLHSGAYGFYSHVLSWVNSVFVVVILKWTAVHSTVFTNAARNSNVLAILQCCARGVLQSEYQVHKPHLIPTARAHQCTRLVPFYIC